MNDEIQLTFLRSVKNRLVDRQEVLNSVRRLILDERQVENADITFLNALSKRENELETEIKELEKLQEKIKNDK